MDGPISYHFMVLYMQVSNEDKGWVDKTINDLCKEAFTSDLIKQVDEPLYFVDFLREPVTDPETGVNKCEM
jgi:dynein heavy chain